MARYDKTEYSQQNQPRSAPYSYHAAYSQGSAPQAQPSSHLLNPSESRYHGLSYEGGQATAGRGQPQPNWRPRSLGLRPWLLLLGIIIIIVIGVLFHTSKTHGYIVSRGKATDFFFQIGPVVVATVVAEMIGKMAADLGKVYPFMALSSPMASRLRKSPLAGLSDVPFRSKFATMWQKIALFCAFIFVPLHALLFQITSYQPPDIPADIISFQQSALYETLGSSLAPSFMLEPVWAKMGLRNSQFVSQSTSYSVMPFYPITGHPDTVTHEASAVFGSLIPSDRTHGLDVAVTPARNGTWDVEVHLKDEAGCEFQQKIRNSPLLGPPDHSRGAVGDNTFAIWQMAMDGIQPSSNRYACNPYNQFAVVGIFDPSFLTGLSQRETVDTSSRTNWAGLSFGRTLAILRNETISVDFDSSLVRSSNFFAQPPLSLKFSHSTPIYADGIDRFMKRNFLDTHLIYKLTNPFFGSSFWGKTLHQAGLVIGEGELSYNANGTSFLSENCPKDNLGCRVMTSSFLLWSSLFSFSVPIATLFAPSQAWVYAEGSQSAPSTEGWSISGVMVGVAVVLYLLAIGCLFRPLALPRTGLVRSPGSIASKALLFRSGPVRQRFSGLDMVNPKQFHQSYKDRFPQSPLSLELTQQSTNQFSACEDPAVTLTSNQTEYAEIIGDWQQIWRGSISKLMHYTVWVSFFLASIALIVVTWIFVYPRIGSGIYLWYQPPSSINAVNILNYLPTQPLSTVLNLAPTIIFQIFGLWWTVVDDYFRATQPFIGLHRQRKGKDSVCVDYNFNDPVTVPFIALRKRHTKLGLVTLMTLTMKFATIFAGGIFIKGDGTGFSSRLEPITRYWRNNTFVLPQQDLDSTELQHLALAHSVAQLNNYSNWDDGRHAFVNIPFPTAGNGINVDLEGVTASLSCAEAGVEMKNHTKTEPQWWPVSLTNTSCKGAIRDLFDWKGNLTDFIEDLVEDGSSTITVSTWKYLDSDTCNGNSEGAWWILSRTITMSTSNEVVWVADRPETSSLICEPRYSLDTVKVRAYNDSFGFPHFDTHGVITSRPLEDDRWNLQGDASTGFTSYFSNALNASHFVRKSHSVAEGLQLDYLSMMMYAYNPNPSLRTPDHLAAGAARAFSKVFTLFVTQPTDDEGGAVLMQPPAPHLNRTVTVHEVTIVARIYTPAFYTAMAILIIYVLALLLLYPGRERRSHTDASTVAGIAALVYDSSIASRILDADGRPTISRLGDTRFAYGFFTGQSGEQRYGIEAEDRVEYVRPKPSTPRRAYEAMSAWIKGLMKKQDKLLGEESGADMQKTTLFRS